MTEPEHLAKIRTLLNVFLGPRSTALGPYEEEHSVPNLSAAQQKAFDALCSEAGLSTHVATGAGPEERVERMRELVRILLNCPEAPADAIGMERRKEEAREHRAAFEKLKEHLGVGAN